MRHAEFRDPRLVAVYDAAFGWSRDDDFFLSVAGEEPAPGKEPASGKEPAPGSPPGHARDGAGRQARGARVLDLGCGTGRLTLALAAAGHAVTGVDPARASLEAARAKPGAGLVTWIEGTSADLPDAAFDVAVMTSHVAQFFVTDSAWEQALADLRRALVPGGRLTFDTRDPAARGWERWNPADWTKIVTLPDGRRVTMWIEVTGLSGGPAQGCTVDSAIHYEFPGDGELLSTATLRFRTHEQVRASLATAGFTVEHVYGGWNREPVGAPDGELLVIARAGTAP